MKKKLIAVILVLVISVTLCIGLVGCMPSSVSGAFKSIKKNNNYQYDAYEQRPIIPMQIIFISSEKNYRAVDNGVNKFVIDYTLKGENVGVYKEINNIWSYEEIFEGTEGTGMNKDNRALVAFDLAVANFTANFVYDKENKCYYPTDEIKNKIFENTIGGTCKIYKKKGKIYIDSFYGIDNNNKERIIINRVGGVSVSVPKAQNGNIIE